MPLKDRMSLTIVDCKVLHESAIICISSPLYHQIKHSLSSKCNLLLLLT